MSHTPGPWTWKEDDYNDIHFGTMRCRRVDGADGSNILSVVGLTEADARLIAAAPELLEACESAASQLVWAASQLGRGNACEAIAEDCNAAIRKATGEQP